MTGDVGRMPDLELDFPPCSDPDCDGFAQPYLFGWHCPVCGALWTPTGMTGWRP